MEGEGLEVGVEPGSPPADGSAAPDPSAGTQNTDQNGQPQGRQNGQQSQTVPYGRFQEVIRRNQQLEAAVKQMQTAQERIQQPGGQTREEQAQYREAAAALRRVMESDPQLAQLLKAIEGGKLTQTMTGVENLTRAQQDQQLRTSADYIKGLAKEAKLDISNDRFARHLVQMVAKEAMQLPDGEARYDAGDMSVLKEAFENVQKEVFGQFKRAAGQSLFNSKTATAGLPPAPRGSFAGQPAAAKPEPGKEREYTAGLHKKALAMLEQAFSG